MRTFAFPMWKIIEPGEKITLGDTVRFLPSSNSPTCKEKLYQVFKTEQHYFEIIAKFENDKFMDNPVRRIVRYMDIGYHIGMEVWIEASVVPPNDLNEPQSKQVSNRSIIGQNGGDSKKTNIKNRDDN